MADAHPFSDTPLGSQLMGSSDCITEGVISCRVKAHPAYLAELDGSQPPDGRPTVWPPNHLSPVAFKTRPSLPASSISLLQRGQSASISRRQDALSAGSP